MTVNIKLFLSVSQDIPRQGDGRQMGGIEDVEEPLIDLDAGVGDAEDQRRGEDGEKTNSDIQTRSEKPVAFIFFARCGEARKKVFRFVTKSVFAEGLKVIG